MKKSDIFPIILAVGNQKRHFRKHFPQQGRFFTFSSTLTVNTKKDEKCCVDIEMPDIEMPEEDDKEEVI